MLAFNGNVEVGITLRDYVRQYFAATLDARGRQTWPAAEQQPTVGGPAKVIEHVLGVDRHPTLGDDAISHCRIEMLADDDIAAHWDDAPLKFREFITGVTVWLQSNVVSADSLRGRYEPRSHLRRIRSR